MSSGESSTMMGNTHGTLTTAAMNEDRAMPQKVDDYHSMDTFMTQYNYSQHLSTYRFKAFNTCIIKGFMCLECDLPRSNCLSLLYYCSLYQNIHD